MSDFLEDALTTLRTGSRSPWEHRLADEIERLQSRLDDAAKTLQIASYDMTRRRYMLDEKAFSRIIEALNGDKSNDRQ